MSTDSELIEATLSGDRSAFGKLVSRYQTKSYQLACRIIRNPFDASDIVQEAFVKAYQNLWQLKDRDKFLSWLFQIVKNQCMNWIRKHQRNLMAVEEELANDRLRLSPAPDSTLIERELHKQIMEAISKLPAYERKAVEMFYFEDKSYSEIQDELGITKGTLGRLLNQARAKLRKNLQKAYQGTVFSIGVGLKRILRLIPEPTTQTSMSFVVQCLAISVMLHLALLTGISITGLLWGTSNEANSNARYGSVMRASLVNQGLPDLSHLPSYINAKLPLQNSIQRSSLRQDQSAEIAEAENATHKSPPSRPERLRLDIAQTMSIPAVSPQITELAAGTFRNRSLPHSATRHLTAKPLHATIYSKPGQDIPDSSGGRFIGDHQPDTSEATLDTASAPTTKDFDPMDTWEALPDSYGPFYVYDRPVLNVRKVLGPVAAMARIRQYRARILQTESRRVLTGILESYDASTLQAMTEGSHLSTVLAAGCDLEALKAFVASDMAPLVITRSPVGPKHIRAMVGYDDSTERLVLMDPINYAVARFGYSEFCKQWDDPQNACLLVFPQRTALLETVRSCLDRYLPARKAESISIHVSRRR